MSKHPSVDSILRSGTITDVQTLDLRGHIYKDSKISEVEADWLFELNASRDIA
jgi:hypothetical protein